MYDFSLRLRENAHLLALLAHYARTGSEDRTAWQDRLMRLDGLDPRDLTALHGELIAFDWVEQNTGYARLRPDGTIGACYRVTPHGLREYRQIQGIEVVEEPPEAAEKAPPRVPRKKKVRTKSPVGATAESSSQSGDPCMTTEPPQ